MCQKDRLKGVILQFVVRKLNTVKYCAVQMLHGRIQNLDAAESAVASEGIRNSSTVEAGSNIRAENRPLDIFGKCIGRRGGRGARMLARASRRFFFRFELNYVSKCRKTGAKVQKRLKAYCVFCAKKCRCAKMNCQRRYFSAMSNSLAWYF